MLRCMKIPFGTIDKRTLELARGYLGGPLETGHLTEGVLTTEFEKRFAREFGWSHAVAVSSGTTAGEVLWAALRMTSGAAHFGMRRMNGGRVYTPACAFVATGNCLLAAGIEPRFVDVKIDSLNLDEDKLRDQIADDLSVDDGRPIGVQFVATMGSLNHVGRVKLVADRFDLPLVGDLCEAHGAWFHGHASQYFKAAIYSLYPAHLVVAGEGGVICTDDALLAESCRSIKSHGRPAGSNYFDFVRPAFNAKWSDLHAAVGLASLDGFKERFRARRIVRDRLLDALSKFEQKIALFRDAPGEIVSPHAFPVLIKEGQMRQLYRMLEWSGVECKTLFGSLPTQHDCFADLPYELGEFPVAEEIGRVGLHFGCGEFRDAEIAQIVKVFEDFFSAGIAQALRASV